MKRLSILLLFLAALLVKSDSSAQSLEVLTSFDFAMTDMIVNHDNQLVVVGVFNGQRDFDPSSDTFLLKVTLNDNNTDDSAAGFIAKYDANGQLITAKGFGEHRTDYPVSETFIPNAVTQGASGSYYIAGSFRGSIDFDPDTSKAVHTSTVGNIIILKFDSALNFVWSKQLEGPSTVADIITDSQENFFISGKFADTMDFDPGPGKHLLYAGTINHNSDIFFCKYDSNGNLLFAHDFGMSTERNLGGGLILDEQDNVYQSIVFEGIIDVDPSNAVNSLNANNKRASATTKYDNNGNYLSAIQHPVIGGMSSLHKGEIYYIGSFYDTYDFDPGPAEFKMTPMGSGDAYVLKLDTQGNFINAYQFGGNTDVFIFYTMVDNDNNVYVVGLFRNSVDVDPGPDTLLLTKVNRSVSYNGIFICKLDSSFSPIWVTQIERFNTNHISSVIMANGELCTKGIYWGSIRFNPRTIDSTLDASNSFSNSFFIKQRDCPAAHVDTLHITACDSLVSPSKKYTWYSSGTYRDSIYTKKACDSIVYIDLVIDRSTSNSIGVNACSPYTSPSGNLYSTSGFYSDTIMNHLGCDSILSINLVITNIDTTVNQSGFFLTSNALPPAKYQWLDCNLNYSAMPNDTNQSFVPTKNGSYAVEVTKGACVDTSACITTSVGLTEIDQPNGLKIIPNPTNGHIRIDNLINNEETIISIYNSNGQLVDEQKVYSKDDVIFIHGESGVYFLRAVSKRQKAIFKLVKN